MIGLPEPTAPADRVRRERDRVVDRLRWLPAARLDRPGDDGRSPADVARELAQGLADAAADAEGRPRRAVPRLDAVAVGDQVAVTVADLLAATTDDGVLGAAADRLVGLRRRL